MRDPQKKAGELDVVVVGAGFSGLYALYRLREFGFSVRLLEEGSGVGGTWFWNRYPGARCDSPSFDYSYSFSPELEQEWTWTERYPRQADILRYLNHVADRFDLRRDIQLETRVTSAVFDEATCRWTIGTDGGETFSAQYCVMATGCLSARNAPDFKGLDTFEGDWYQTSAWPQEGVDFTGRRVGVVGTGSSGIQAIPVIAKEAAHVFVFQRTPNFSVPARNHPLDEGFQRQMKANLREYRRKARESVFGVPLEMPQTSALDIGPEERERDYASRWAVGGAAEFMLAYSDLMTNREANATAAEFVRARIRETVRDPEVAELLAPKDHPFGSKRLCVDTDYYETYNRDNVTLVDVRTSPIERITPRGLRTRDAEYELDSIVFAIGFDALTGALLRIDIRGRGGRTLWEKWSEGPRAYLGVAMAGFPNLFAVTGPTSPSVLSNMPVSIEQHVEWIADCIVYMRELGLDAIEAEPEAENAWFDHANELAGETLFVEADSYYVGANVPGKPRVFMPYLGGVGSYRERCDEVAANGYEGFRLSSNGREPR